MAGASAEPSHLAVGHVTKPHGTKGEVFVWPLTDEPEAVFAPGRNVWMSDAEGMMPSSDETLEIHHVRPFKRGFLVSFVGRFDRNDVEDLAGRYLMVPLEELTPPDADEAWYHQLIGLRVELSDGTTVGTIREVFENSPADLIEVELADGRRVLVPAAKAIVRAVDVQTGRLVIDPPAGLLEL